MPDTEPSYGYTIRMGAVDLYQDGELRVSVPWADANRLVVLLSYYKDIIDMNPGDELAEHNLQEQLAIEIDERAKTGVSFQPIEDGHRVLFKGQPCGWLTLDTEYYEVDPGYRSSPWRFSGDRVGGGRVALRRYGDELEAIDHIPDLVYSHARISALARD